MATATVERRLAALELSYGSGDGCPLCGARPGESVRYVVVEQVSGPEYCDGCGRRLWLALQWPEQRAGGM